MSRKFIAAVLAASIAVTGFSSAPAKAASEDDIAGILAGVAGLIIIGQLLDDDDDDEPRVSRRHTHIDNGYWYRGDHRHPGHIRRDTDRRTVVTPRRDRPSRVDLPRSCRKKVRTQSGEVRLYTRGCLRNNYRNAASLPRSCMRRFQTRNGAFEGYYAKCLRQHGYRRARR